MEIYVGSVNKEDAFAIAKGLPDFFNANGLVTLSADLDYHDLRGVSADGKLVGFITLRKADVGSLEISWLAINKDFQGLGIGSRLVKEALNDFCRQGFRICYVKTLAETAADKGYEKTREFYKKLGFNTLEIIDPYPGWSVGNPCQILATPLPLSE